MGISSLQNDYERFTLLGGSKSALINLDYNAFGGVQERPSRQVVGKRIPGPAL